MEEYGRLQSTGSQTVRHDLATSLSLHFSWTRHQVFSGLSLFLLVHENLFTTEEMEIQSLENFPGIIQMASGRARVQTQLTLSFPSTHDTTVKFNLSCSDYHQSPYRYTHHSTYHMVLKFCTHLWALKVRAVNVHLCTHLTQTGALKHGENWKNIVHLW